MTQEYCLKHNVNFSPPSGYGHCPKCLEENSEGQVPMELSEEPSASDVMDVIGACIVGPVGDPHTVTFHFNKPGQDAEEILRIDGTGFYYRGERVEDVHDMYHRFSGWVNMKEDQLWAAYQEIELLKSQLSLNLKPQLYGRMLNIEPMLKDPVKHIYQVNYRDIKSVEAVRDQGMALGPATPPDVSDVFAWTPVAGYYVTDLSKGMFRLGATPAGKVTCDVDGGTAE